MNLWHITFLNAEEVKIQTNSFLLYFQKKLNQNIVSELLDQSLKMLDICSRPIDLSILQVYLTQL